MPVALLALLAGALSVLAYAPFGVFPLIVVSLAVLFHLWRSVAESPWRAAWLGFCWGLGAFFAGIGWLIVALNRYGGMPLPLAVICILLFAAAMAMYPALVGACVAIFRRRVQGDGRLALVMAACWTLGEGLRGWLFTGFPWLSVGYSQTPPSPLAGFAPVLGIYGVGFLVALVATGLAVVWRQRARWVPVGLGIAAVLLAGVGLRQVAWTHPVGAPLKVALVQTAIPQDQKWDRDRYVETLNLNEAAVTQSDAQLVVTPETALPTFMDQLPDGYLTGMDAALRARQGMALLGVLTREGEHQRNSAVTLGATPPRIYSKQHLVPFGEYAPPLFGWFYTLVKIPMSGLSRGEHQPKPLALAGQQIAVNICYEDLFGEELIYALPEATLMLNLSNLAWYGDLHAQPQHLQIARMRALETGRPMLRATNTGMTAWVSPDGQVQAVLPAFKRETLTVSVTGYAGMTPYARSGNLPAFSIALLGLTACFVRWRTIPLPEQSKA